MKNKITFQFSLALILLGGTDVFYKQHSNGLAPAVTLLNLKDNLYQLEAKLPYLEKPYTSLAPEDKNDGLVVGKLGVDGGNSELVQKFTEELAATSKVEKEPKGEKTTGTVDSLLINYMGKLIFESYDRQGRANIPHYQMSITKSYTALALGRAIQLGLLKLEHIDKPTVGFLKKNGHYHGLPLQS